MSFWAGVLKRAPRALAVLLGVDSPAAAAEPERHVKGPLPPSKASAAFDAMEAQRAAKKPPASEQ